MSRAKLYAVDGNGEAQEHPDSVPVLSAEAALMEELVEARRTISALKGELTKLRKVDPQASDIQTVLERWHRKCRHSSPRVKFPTDGKRWKVVKARLADYTVEQLCEVVEIAALLPFEQYGRRYTEPAPGRVRRDDLDYLMASEVRVEAILAIRHAPIEFRAYEHFVYDLSKRHPVVMAVGAMLAGQDPHGEVLARFCRWAKKEEDKGKGGKEDKGKGGNERRMA